MSNQRLQRKGILTNLLKRRKSIPGLSENSASNQSESALLDYYISFVQNHPDIILIIALDGEVIATNKSNGNNYLGFHDKQQVLSKDYMTEKEYDLLEDAFNKAKRGKSTQIEFTLTNKQGKLAFLIGTFIPISLTKRHIEAVTLILKDLTDFKQLEKKYELKVNHLEQAQQIANIGSFEYDIAQDIFSCTDECYLFTGIDISEYTLDNLFSIIHPIDQEYIQHLFNRAIKKGIGFSTEYRIYHRKTKELLYMNTNVKVILENDQPAKLVGVMQDISKLKQLNLQLEDTNEQYQNIFNQLHVGIWMRESFGGNITFASKGLASILQIPLESIYKHPNSLESLILPGYEKRIAEKNEQLKKGHRTEHRYRILDGEGTTKWIYEQLIPELDNNGEISHIFGRIADISHEIEMESKLAFMSRNDGLTTLPNQHSLYEKLDDYILRDDIKNFALLSIDIDNFSWINNFLGHNVGNEVLQSISNRLIKSRPDNGYLARLASDSFVYIVANFNDKNEIIKFANELKSSIKAAYLVEDYELYVTSSIGISFYPENGDNKLDLLENSNSALTFAKELGKNNIQIYSFDRDLATHKKYVLELDLRKAIQNEDFELYYQPKVNPKTGAILGAEALIRWVHKEWGVVSPAEFIPIAEEKHLIHHIGNWVIKTVCAQLKSWKEQGKELYPISINISPIRFLRNDLVGVIQRELEKNYVDPKLIEIEITEGTLLRNETYVLDTLNRLRKLGVIISLDDFGSGHTSFLYLQNFDIDTLKIDKRFIQNVNVENSKNTAIITSLFHMAKGLNMNIVVEGVEEYEQLEFLKQKECDAVQGFIYSKAVPVHQFEKLMTQHYLKPKKKFIMPEKERRKYFRFILPHYLPVTLKINRVNNKQVNMGTATILVENISLGGLKLLTTLRLPVISNMKLSFQFSIMDEDFNLNGILVYKEPKTKEVFSYGVSFEDMSEGEKDQLAKVINRMTALKRLNNEIPNTEFITVSSTKFFEQHLI